MSQTTRERHSGRRPQQCVGRRRQQGAALVIGLILLLILTLLAVTGMNTATTELVMAGNEQYRNNASHAASTGIEEAIPGIAAVPTVEAAPVTVAPTPVPGSDPAPAVADTYSTSTQYVGEETGLPQSSANKFVGLHYVITSTGRSARSAKDVQLQGVLVVAPAGSSGGDFGKTGKGLGP